LKSRFIDLDVVFDFNLADWAFVYIFAAFHADGIVSAWHVERVLLIFVANDAFLPLRAAVLVSLNVRAVDLYLERGHGADFEAVQILESEFGTGLALLGKPDPRAEI